jgi:hypothetical protein
MKHCACSPNRGLGVSALRQLQVAFLALLPLFGGCVADQVFTSPLHLDVIPAGAGDGRSS